MAEYQKKLESAADALARRQLGLEPKKEGVEEKDRLPEIYKKFKLKYLSVLEESFTEICAQMKLQLGVRHLSDDTMLIIANKINDKAISGDLKFVSNLSQDKEIVAAVEDASRVQRQQTTETNAIEGEGIGKDNTANQVVVGAVGIAALVGMKDMSLEELAQSQKDVYDLYYSEEGKKKREAEADARREAIKNAGTLEEKNNQAHNDTSYEFLIRNVEMFERKQKGGDPKALQVCIRNIVLYAATSKENPDSIIANATEVLKRVLPPEQMQEFLQKIEDGSSLEDFTKATLELESKERENNGGKAIPDIDKEYERLHALEFGKDFIKRKIEYAEMSKEQREFLEQIKKMKSETIRAIYADGNVSYDNIVKGVDFFRENDIEIYSNLVERLGKRAVEVGDLRLLGIHQEYIEKDKQEREAQVAETKEVVVEESTASKSETLTTRSEDDFVR